MSYYQGTPQTIVKYTKKLTTNGSHKSVLFAGGNYETSILLRASVLNYGCSSDSAIIVHHDLKQFRNPQANNYDDWERVIEYVPMTGSYNPELYYTKAYGFSIGNETGTTVGTYNFIDKSKPLTATRSTYVELGANISGISNSSEYLYMEAYFLVYRHSDTSYDNTNWTF